MTAAHLLVLLPAPALASAFLLWAAGQRLSGGAVSRLAAASVWLTWALSLALARPVLAAQRSSAASPLRATLGPWIEAGHDLVELTVAATDLPAVQPIPASGVTTSWWSLDVPGLPGLVAHTWEASAVVGERPLPNAIAAGTPLTRWNVPPGLKSFRPTEPRRQHGFHLDAVLECDPLALLAIWLILGGSLGHHFRLGRRGGAARDPLVTARASLLTGGSLIVVLAGSLLLASLGWALLSLARCPCPLGSPGSPNAAARDRRGLIGNRVSDALFLVGAMLTWCVFGSLSYRTILSDAADRLPPSAALAPTIAILFSIALAVKAVALCWPGWPSGAGSRGRGVTLAALAIFGPAVAFQGWRMLPIYQLAWSTLLGRSGFASVAAFCAAEG